MRPSRETANFGHTDIMPMLYAFPITERNQCGDISPVTGSRIRGDAPLGREVTIEAIDPFNGSDVHLASLDRRATEAWAKLAVRFATRERISLV